jgi:DNA adenine methylase
MTAYHGGKQRIGKKLAEIIYDESTIIEKEDGFEIKGYCEPFCGMLGVYQQIPDLFEDHKPRLKYMAGDTNKSVIMMWQAAQKGWKPPKTSTEKEYDRLWNSGDSALKGYIGHQYSFGGQFFNGYAPKYGKTKDSSKASNNVVKIASRLKKVSFYSKPYTHFSNLQGYVIYCDPPYDNTLSRYYTGSKKERKKFDSDEFFNWCRKMSEKNIVYVSSYNAPKDFECIFSSSHKLTGINTSNKKRTEKLYII